MVKGTSHRVIVVRSPDPRFFEQAVFFLKEDAFHRDGVSADQVLAEAGQVAAGYLRRSSPVRRRLHLLRPLLWAGLGACLTGLVWAITLIAF